jgi:multimeric flavodoxin WrbA
MPSNERLAQQKLLQQFAQQYREHAAARKTINILGISCSTVNTDDDIPRVPSSEKILIEALDYAKDSYNVVDTKLVKLRDVSFAHCEANYSIKGEYCTWPCWISQRKKEDELVGVYNLLVDWADVIIIATPIRRGAPASMYFKFIERLNCLENQKEVYGVDLLGHQQMGFVIVWAQDGVQACLGQMMAQCAQMGFSFPKHSYVGYTSGNYTNDEMEQTPVQIQKDSDSIAAQYKEMIDNQIDIIKRHRH